jgi:two-component system sensor histidine kinase VicK
MKTSLRKIVFYLDVTLVAILLVLANYFHDKIAQTLPLLPTFIVPLVSVLIFGLIIYLFWRRESESEFLKQEFITVVTHKFRTPIAGMKWAIQSLSNDINFQQNRDLLASLEKATQRITEIVDSLIGFATFEQKYAYEFLSLRTLADESLQKHAELIRNKKITFDIQTGKDQPWVLIDRTKIQFVIDILLENAIKYSPAGGLVTLQFNRVKNQIIFSISDKGIGISQPDLRRIFHRFWRSADAKTIDTEGMGIGLYTAKAVVEHHGGRLWAESPGRGLGATFFVQLKTAGGKTTA